MYSDYLFLENKIKDFILSKDIQPYTKFPSERALMESLGISRTQVRKVLKSLVDQGILMVKKSSGYYLAPTKISINLNEQHSYFDPTSYKSVRTRFVTINEIQLNKKTSKLLNSKDGSGYELLGIQLFNNIPYGIITSNYLQLEDNLIDSQIYETYSLFDIFHDSGRPIAHMKEEISSKNSTIFEEKLLNLSKKSPLAKHEIYCYDEQGQCILYQNILYPINKVEFRGWAM